MQQQHTKTVGKKTHAPVTFVLSPPHFQIVKIPEPMGQLSCWSDTKTSVPELFLSSLPLQLTSHQSINTPEAVKLSQAPWTHRTVSYAVSSKTH